MDFSDRGYFGNVPTEGGLYLPNKSYPLKLFGFLAGGGFDSTLDWDVINPADGDLVIIATAADSTNPIVGTGFTNRYSNSGSSPDCSVQTRECDGTETGTLYLGASTSISWVKFSKATMVGAITVSTGTAGMPNPPGISGLVPSDIAITIGMLDDDNVTTWSPPSGWTLGGDHGRVGASCAIAYLTDASGTQNPGVFGPAFSDAWIAATFKIQEA